MADPHKSELALLPQSDARPLTILGDEDDAGGFEGALYHVERRIPGLRSPAFKLPHRDNPHPRGIGKFLLR